MKIKFPSENANVTNLGSLLVGDTFMFSHHVSNGCKEMYYLVADSLSNLFILNLSTSTLVPFTRYASSTTVVKVDGHFEVYSQ